ncbi:MAG: hypothetical protein AB2693_32265 [Candidatus Thiodiazotropha sp.]
MAIIVLERVGHWGLLDFAMFNFKDLSLVDLEKRIFKYFVFYFRSQTPGAGFHLDLFYLQYRHMVKVAL